MQRLDVISQLEAEWEELLFSMTTAQVFRGLQDVEPVLAELEDLANLVAVMAARGGVHDLERHDEVLLALLRQAQPRTAQGGLAARITMQLMLPGVKGRWGGTHLAKVEPGERPAVLLAALYQEIRAPQSPWKPARVGAQVLGRAYQRLRPRRGAAARVHTVLYGDLDVVGAYRTAYEGERTHPSIEVLELLAESVRAGRLSKDKAHLIAAVRVAGMDIRAVAEELGISYSAAAQRLHRAEVELRRAFSKAA